MKCSPGFSPAGSNVHASGPGRALAAYAEFLHERACLPKASVAVAASLQAVNPAEMLVSDSFCGERLRLNRDPAVWSAVGDPDVLVEASSSGS
jgi:hypothetical protein